MKTILGAPEATALGCLTPAIKTTGKHKNNHLTINRQARIFLPRD
jgi:hypothetical protein